MITPTSAFSLQIRQANAAAPPEHRLSEAELVLDLGRLERMRAQVDAEVAEYIAKAEAEIQATEAKAQELKSLCWDSMQVGVSVGYRISCHLAIRTCCSVSVFGRKSHSMFSLLCVD